MLPWHCLTLRGRLTLCFGILILITGIVFAKRDFVWLGAFACIVSIGAALMICWPVKALRHERRLTVSEVPVGTQFGVTLKLNSSHGAIPRLLHFEDVVPSSMGVRPRFALPGGVPEKGYRVAYTLTGTQRGHHRIGPLLVRSLDPFGLSRNDMAFVTTTEIAVTPQVFDLPGLQSGSSGSSAHSQRANAGLVGQEDVLVREYRPGDDVRRVHWRSTAKVGELMVRKEEQSWQQTTRLLIDNRVHAHAGQGPASSFEWAVSAAASAGLTMIRSGSLLQLSDADGVSRGLGNDGTISAQQLIAELTDITLTQEKTLDAGLFGAAENHLMSTGVLAVVGQLNQADLATLLAETPPSGTAHALLLETPSFTGDPQRTSQDRAAAVLRNHGWTAAVVRAPTSIPDAWSQLLQPHEASMR